MHCIVPIVEGHGEVKAIGILIRRIAAEYDAALTIDVKPPLRIPKSRLLKIGELERTVDFAFRKAGRSGAVLVLLDSDDDCPAELGPKLTRRALAARSDLPLGVVLAKREYEAWFLAAASSLRGQRGLKESLTPPNEPESIRGAKEWLNRNMLPGLRYGEVLDQPALTAAFDLAAARRAGSFDKCYREIVRLLTEFKQEEAPGS